MACGEEDQRSPEARACDEVLSLPDRDETGELESDILRRQLDDWRDVWDHAQDAEPEIREPVRKIVEDLARAVDGDGATYRGNLEVEIAGGDLVLACIDVLESTTTIETYPRLTRSGEGEPRYPGLY